jgi:hypothetical protein
VNGHEFILRLIRHTTTLSKSRLDAEEERRERAAEAVQRQNRPAPRRAERDADLFPDQLTDDEAINDGQDPSNGFVTTTVKRFLKYDNPFLYASRDHRYVIDAICTGQLYGMLPSVVQSDDLLSSSNLTLSQIHSNIRTHVPSSTAPLEFQTPVPVSILEQAQLHDAIESQTQNKRAQNHGASQEGGFDDHPDHPPSDTDWVSDHDPSRNGSDGNGNEDGNNVRRRRSWLRDAIETIEKVRQEYGLDERQSDCYHFMTDRLLFAFHGLGDTQDSRLLTDQCFLYMGGEGGTGKSRIIKAIVD